MAIEKTKGGGWGTVGWGHNMYNGRILTVVPDKEDPTQLNLQECDLIGWRRPECFELKGFTEDREKRKVDHSQGYWYVEFSRDLSLKDEFTNRITYGQSDQPLIWCQTPENQYKMHHGLGMFGIVNVDFSNDQKYPGKRRYEFWVAFHQWGLLLSWTFGIDLAILIARYSKTIPFYHLLHSILVGLASVVTLVSVFGLMVWQIANGNFFIYPGFTRWESVSGFFHYTTGLVIVVLLL